MGRKRKKKRREQIEIREFNGISYRRYAKDVDNRPRGTVQILDPSTGNTLLELAPYPHINRVYRLEAGIKRNFGENPFFVEEKVDGYNVRVVKTRGKLLAFTRGGFVCPFTSEWAAIRDEEYGLSRFFEDNPYHVLCGEVLGDTPYNKQGAYDLSPGAHIYFFDVLGPKFNFLTPPQRYDLFSRYNLPTVPVFGEFSAERIDELKEILLDLNNREREGVVMKDTETGTILKFVTPTTDLEDIRDGMLYNFDLHENYFKNRLLRMPLFIQEFGLDKEEYSRKIGEAFMEGMQPLEDFKRAEVKFTIYVLHEHTWEAVRNVIGKQVHTRLDSFTEVELLGRKMFKVEFRRFYKQSTHTFHSLVNGFPFTD